MMLAFVGLAVALAHAQRLAAGELTIGFRASREIIVKTSYYARQVSGRQNWDQQGGVAIVWQRRVW